jgi:sensor histidine kinase YesM
MKHKFCSFGRINNRLFAFLFIAILAIILLTAVMSMPVTEKNLRISHSIKSIEYLEDAAGNLSLEEIRSGNYDKSFLHEAGSSLSIGQSRSAWWIRINLNEMSTDSFGKYLSIKNPTVERAVAYIPEYSEGEVRYTSLSSGWGFSGRNQDEGYLYPIFKLNDKLDKDQYLYLRICSPFTQNYNIGIFSERELDWLKLENLFIMGIFYGLLLAMGISNFISFLSFKDNVQLYYVIYILSMLFYHGALLGLFRLFLGTAAEAFIGNVVALGLFMVAAEVLFLRSFLVTAESYPRQDKILILILLLCLVGILLMGFNLKYEASVFSILPAIGIVLVTVYISILAVWNGVRSAKYFLAGWCAMLFGFSVFTARVWGILPNNDLTLFIVLISAAIESLLLSVALADRVRVLRNEKEQAVLLFRSAEETSLYNESAFLQAQIKPHFLYNALNIIAALCRIDAEKARMLILDLSSYLHHNFDFGNLKKYISFEEELDFIKAYIRIEQARFPGKLKMEYELDNIKELQIPPLMLQPLVENAIRHGIRKSDQGETIILRVKNQESNYRIEVEDNGAGMTREQIDRILSESGKESSGIGLANIRRRLQMLYGTQLMIESVIGKGTKISMILPKRRDAV